MSLGSIVYIGLLVGICLYFVNGVVHRICQCIEKCNAAEWRADVEKYKLYFSRIIRQYNRERDASAMAYAFEITQLYM